MQNVEILHRNNEYIVAFCPIITNKSELKIISSKISNPNFKSTKRKNEWLTTHYILESIFNKSITYTYNDLKKPVLTNRKENISISHSANYVSVIVSKNKKVGIDVEEITPRIHKIAHKFLNETEKKYLDLSERKTEMLYVIWCAKESIYKLSDKYLDFPSQIIIKKFNLTDNIIRAEINYSNKVKCFELHCVKTDDCVVVWLAD